MVCEVPADQIGAAVVAVETVVQRAIEELEAPWEQDRVWLNDQPLLGGTRIQAIMVGPSGDPDSDALVHEGERVGRLDTITMLTTTEAQLLAHMGPGTLPRVLSGARLRFADVTRDQDALQPSRSYPDLPVAGPGTGRRRDETSLLSGKCMVTRRVTDAPVHWIEWDEQGVSGLLQPNRDLRRTGRFLCLRDLAAGRRGAAEPVAARVHADGPRRGFRHLR